MGEIEYFLFLCAVFIFIHQQQPNVMVTGRPHSSMKCQDSELQFMLLFFIQNWFIFKFLSFLSGLDFPIILGERRDTSL